MNDEHFEDFTYRGDPENISTLNIKGRVNIQETEYLGSMVGLSVCLSVSHPVLYMFFLYSYDMNLNFISRHL